MRSSRVVITEGIHYMGRLMVTGVSEAGIANGAMHCADREMNTGGGYNNTCMCGTLSRSRIAYV